MLIGNAERVVELELTGHASGTPVEPLAGALQHPFGPRCPIRQHRVRSSTEIELSVAVGMRTGEREKSTGGRMQHVRLVCWKVRRFPLELQLEAELFDDWKCFAQRQGSCPVAT